jgi:hypothetical protein
MDKVLTDTQRETLEGAVEAARIEAESGAQEALRFLTVEAAEAGGHLSDDQRAQRRNLRAHARSLGDRRQPDGRQEIARLAAECAYAHWHRMLFARFLAENALLLHPDEGYAIAIDELQEWADEWKLKSRWEAAERCAARMLPQIFGASGAVLAVELPRNRQGELERLLETLPVEVFRARDALGWVYQFWQSAEKARINKSEVKIGADELPAVTQLFTEPYMVDFLLQNTLGAWWVGRHPGEELPAEMPYLRFVDEARTQPAAGTFEGWPKTAKELKVMDPCCGSGHFLVAVFDLMVAFRMREEGLVPVTAVMSVLTENLHGLEIDPRCTQIAAFAVAFRAWTFVGRWFELPELHIACVGLGIRAEKADWLALANGNDRFRNGMSRMYDLFAQAPVLGSLIDPTSVENPLLEAPFEELTPLLTEALGKEKWTENDDVREMGTVAQGIAKAAAILGSRYDLIVTNPPYLIRRKQRPELIAHIAGHQEVGSGNLATALLIRLLAMLRSSGSIASVTPQNWFQQGTYEAMRSRLLSEFTWHTVAKLGTGAFAMITGEVVNVGLTVIGYVSPGAESMISVLDAELEDGPPEKSEKLQRGDVSRWKQSSQLENTDSRVIFDIRSAVSHLSLYCSSVTGVQTGDYPRYVRQLWELLLIDDPWERYQTPPDGLSGVSGLDCVIRWGDDEFGVVNAGGAYIRGESAWGRTGILVSLMKGLASGPYHGAKFDQMAAVLLPHDAATLAALHAFVTAPEFGAEIRRLDNAIKTPPGTLVKVPFDLAHWQAVAAEKYPNGLPTPSSDDPTQWLFLGDIPSSTRPLQVAIARLVGYRWPDQPANPVLDAHVDNDGLVCLPAVRQEQSAADRLLALLAAAYGAAWSPGKLDELLAQENGAGMTLEIWLRKRFFEQHCELFGQRPFIWQVWDGLNDGFSVLIHYHRLTTKGLDTLIHADLGDWINRQEAAATDGVVGADMRLAAARALKTKLELIAEGEEPYDIFVRWKALDAQPVGWDPDLDDGVRLNIRPFVTAGVLRKPPKIHWRTDRGQDPATAPWYPTFQGARVNDHHLSLKTKRDARQAKAP